jgi:K+-sensing histidine kinase KdpD
MILMLVTWSAFVSRYLRASDQLVDRFSFMSRGIAEDERNLIFQRFWRRDRRKAGSTGLGLSIVQRITELHSATITLENRRPAGARFSLKFMPLRP